MSIFRYTPLSTDTPVLCGDGSPAGIYSNSFFGVINNNTSNSNKNTNNNHIIVLQSGGFCATDEECINLSKSRPFRFSNEILLSEFVGTTILSDSHNINPSMYDFNNKWFVPYCSQDLYTGNGQGSIGGFVRSGSLHVLAALDHIQKQHSSFNRTAAVDDDDDSDGNGSGDGTLVVVGISAGTIGVINHIDAIRQLALQLNVNKLKIILDSSFFEASESRVAVNNNAQQTLSSNFVNHTLHPLCAVRQDPTVSKIPCCISIHCHIEHGLFQAKDSASNTTLPEESFLMLDSQYDVLATLELASEIVVGATTEDMFGGNAFDTKINEKLFGTGELAGTRQHSAIDSTLRMMLSGNNNLNDNNNNNTNVDNVMNSNNAATPVVVIWALPNCVTHPFLVPALSLEANAFCQQHVPVEENLGEFTYCTDTAIHFGRRISTSGQANLDVALAISTDIYKFARVGQYTIRNLIGGFVDADRVPFDPPLVLNELGNLNDSNSSTILVSTVLTDDCSGPNCVPVSINDPAQQQNFCQSLISTDKEFQGVPLRLTVVLSLFMFCFMACFFLRFGRRNKENNFSTSSSIFETKFCSSCVKRKESNTMVEQTLGLQIDNLTGSTQAGQPLLVDVCLKLSPGSVNGLLGRSGSGKSTLLGAISGQMRPGVILSSESQIHVDIGSTTYLRQHDHVEFGNLTPLSFLSVCADIYGTESSRLDQICSFVKPFFPKRISENDDDERRDKLPEPFETNKIDSCSGGQRRALAVGAALLTGPSVILLDEPLSGLDSIASERLMNFLREVACAEDLTVLVTVHQPSDNIIESLDKLIILDTGRVIYDEFVEITKHALYENDEGSRMSEFVHDLVKNGKLKDSFNTVLLKARDELSGITLQKYPTRRKRSIARCSTLRLKAVTEQGTDHTTWFVSDFISQTRALSRRLSLQFGNNWSDAITNPVCVTIVALLLSIRKKTPIQVSVASMFLISFPTIVYSHHSLVHEQVWAAHRAELDDRRILCSAYYVASFCYSMSLPVFGLLLSCLISFAIFRWDYSAFLVSWLYMSFQLLFVLEIGRSLCLVFRGHYLYWKLTLVLIFLDQVFSGLFASPADSPPSITWIFALSWTHWVWSGFSLNLFHSLDRITETPCQSFLSCVTFDTPVVSATFGFGFYATPLRSMCVIVACYALSAICEFLLIRNRRTSFTLLSRSKKNNNTKNLPSSDKKPGLPDDDVNLQDGSEKSI